MTDETKNETPALTVDEVACQKRIANLREWADADMARGWETMPSHMKWDDFLWLLGQAERAAALLTERAAAEEREVAFIAALQELAEWPDLPGVRFGTILNRAGHAEDWTLRRTQEEDEAIFRWLLGEEGEFPESLPGRRYNFRTELRQRLTARPSAPRAASEEPHVRAINASIDASLACASEHVASVVKRRESASSPAGDAKTPSDAERDLWRAAEIVRRSANRFPNSGHSLVENALADRLHEIASRLADAEAARAEDPVSRAYTTNEASHA